MNEAEREALHLKVRGVALWLKTLPGAAPACVDSALDTLLLAADELARALSPTARAPALRTGYGDYGQINRPTKTARAPRPDLADLARKLTVSHRFYDAGSGDYDRGWNAAVSNCVTLLRAALGEKQENHHG